MINLDLPETPQNVSPELFTTINDIYRALRLLAANSGDTTVVEPEPETPTPESPVEIVTPESIIISVVAGDSIAPGDLITFGFTGFTSLVRLGKAERVVGIAMESGRSGNPFKLCIAGLCPLLYSEQIGLVYLNENAPYFSSVPSPDSPVYQVLGMQTTKGFYLFPENPLFRYVP